MLLLIISACNTEIVVDSSLSSVLFHFFWVFSFCCDLFCRISRINWLFSLNMTIRSNLLIFDDIYLILSLVNIYTAFSYQQGNTDIFFKIFWIFFLDDWMHLLYLLYTIPCFLVCFSFTFGLSRWNVCFGFSYIGFDHHWRDTSFQSTHLMQSNSNCLWYILPPLGQYLCGWTVPSESISICCNKTSKTFYIKNLSPLCIYLTICIRLNSLCRV